MIVRKNARQLAAMRHAGRIAAEALRLAGRAVEPGVSTWELDKLVHDYIIAQGGYPSSLGYNGFPASCCISLNNTVIHGIPAKDTILKAGDIVSIDIVAKYDGFNADNARTFACGDVSKEAQQLLRVTEESLFEGIARARTGNRLGDIGSAVQQYAESRGYSVVREFVGHGVGADMHEDPTVPNVGTPGRGIRLTQGMTLAIEPMINRGGSDVKILSDDWTVVTADGSLSAHFEHTVAITDSEPEILTLPDGGLKNAL